MIQRTDEDQNWFYVSEGRRQGPLDRRGLVQALLAQDAPEGTLVWRSGLNAWTRAGDLQDLRIELPPPIPGQAEPAVRIDIPPLPTEDGTLAAIGLPTRGETDGEEEEDEEGDLEPPPTDASGAPTGGRRRRRKRKRRHSQKSSPKRVLELLALFLVLALVLWFLLRRMNQVPEGTIIYQGRLSTPPPPRPPSWGPR